MSENFLAFPELRHPFAQQAFQAAGESTVLYQGQRHCLASSVFDDALYIAPEDLTSINGFVLKPEGACLDDLCIPLVDGILTTLEDREWFNLTAFADHIDQPYVADVEQRVWSFGEIPAKRDNMLVNGKAPDLTLTARDGQVVSLADLKGKKALIVTWSSW